MIRKLMREKGARRREGGDGVALVELVGFVVCVGLCWGRERCKGARPWCSWVRM